MSRRGLKKRDKKEYRGGASETSLEPESVREEGEETCQRDPEKEREIPFTREKGRSLKGGDYDTAEPRVGKTVQKVEGERLTERRSKKEGVKRKGFQRRVKICASKGTTLKERETSGLESGKRDLTHEINWT